MRTFISLIPTLIKKTLCAKLGPDVLKYIYQCRWFRISLRPGSHFGISISINIRNGTFSIPNAYVYAYTYVKV